MAMPAGQFSSRYSISALFSGRAVTWAPYFCSAVKMAPITQARPDAHVFMQSHMANLGGQASSSVFIPTSYLGAFWFLRDARRDRFALLCAMDGSGQYLRC